MFARITTIALVASVASLATAEQTCMSPPVRVQPGRDGGAWGDNMCPDQISNCAALCKDGVSVNTCVSDNGGQDNPFEDITYCFECTCADGSTPDLASYYDTIPSDVCERSRESCEYGYVQYGQLAPDGACPTCASQYAVEPTWYVKPTVFSTLSSAAAATTSSAEVETSVTTTSSSEVQTSATTTTSSEDIGASSTSVPTSVPTSGPDTGFTSSSTLSEVSSSTTTTVQLPTTAAFTSTTTSATTRPTTSSTTSVAPVKSAQAAMAEPAMAVFGLGLAAILVM